MIKAKKSLGQNFLTDANISRRIVESVSPQKDQLVIEIGPGTGALTSLLVERSGHVAAVEIDARLIARLEHSIAADNFSIIKADALSIDFHKLIEATVEKMRAVDPQLPPVPRVRVVANLPYYISTPIVERLIALRNRLHDLTLMLQKEVVERITSGPGSKEYGYLSAFVQFYATTTKLFDVPPTAFTPAPKVWSAVARLTMRDKPAVEVNNEARFFALIRAAFAQRRKTILNNLKASAAIMNFDEPIELALQAAGISAQRRAETFTLDEFASLYRALFHM